MAVFMIVQSFCSGSSGNSTIVRAAGTTILIDCGIGPRILQKMLHPHESSLHTIDAVLVTHEHDDHVRGIEAVTRHGLAVHATRGTAEALGIGGSSGSGPITYGDEFAVGGVTITTLQTSHDAAEPCGFSLFDGTSRFTLLTDLGVTDDRCLEIVAESDLIVIEANHDIHMLKSGPYPAHLKRRVLSERGHLSNADCGQFLSHALDGSRKTRSIWLAHLSATNNRPELAERTVSEALIRLPVRHSIIALPRREPGPVWCPGSNPVATEQLSLFT